jgi:hypothetical protein
MTGERDRFTRKAGGRSIPGETQRERVTGGTRWKFRVKRRAGVWPALARHLVFAMSGVAVRSESGRVRRRSVVRSAR